MSEAVRVEELQKLLISEFEKMVDRWERGDLYYHFRSFIKRYTKPWGFGTSVIIGRYICAVLALSRVGLPITTDNVVGLLGKTRLSVHFRLKHLASLKVLEPVDKGKSRFRKYKLTSDFIRHIYTKLCKLK